MLSHSSPSTRGIAGGSDIPGVYKNSGGPAGREHAGLQATSLSQVRRNQGRRGTDRGGRFEREASTRQVEMVAAERIPLAVVKPSRSQAENQENRAAVDQDLRERCRGDRLLRIRAVRRDDDFAELRRKAAIGESECLEPAEVRELPQIFPGLPDARRAGDPDGDFLRGTEVSCVRKPERCEAPVERERDRRRTCDRPTVRFGEPHGIIRVVEADRHPPADHVERRYVGRYFELLRGDGLSAWRCSTIRSTAAA